MSAAATMRRGRHGWLPQLRCVAELAAISGASDAAVAVDSGGDLRVVGSVAGSFAERTLGPQLCPELFQARPFRRERWLGTMAATHLYLPPHAQVLLLPVRSPEWTGAAMLRYDQAPNLSADDLAVLQRALDRFAAETPSAAEAVAA